MKDRPRDESADRMRTVHLPAEEFDALLEYSSSTPTGTTIGKRWKRLLPSRRWLMGEYVEHYQDERGEWWARTEWSYLERLPQDVPIGPV